MILRCPCISGVSIISGNLHIFFELYMLLITASYLVSEIPKIIFCNTVVQSTVQKILKIYFYMYFHSPDFDFLLFLWRQRDIQRYSWLFYFLFLTNHYLTSAYTHFRSLTILGSTTHHWTSPMPVTRSLKIPIKITIQTTQEKSYISTEMLY